MVERDLLLSVQHHVAYMVLAVHEDVVRSLIEDDARSWQVPVGSLEPLFCSILLSPEQANALRRLTVNLNLPMMASWPQ